MQEGEGRELRFCSLKTKFWSKTFLVGIDSVCFKNISKRKSRNQKLFSITIFFWDLIIFGPNGEKWQSQEILVENFFRSESIQNLSKRILNRKSRNRKFFPA